MVVKKFFKFRIFEADEALYELEPIRNFGEHPLMDAIFRSSASIWFQSIESFFGNGTDYFFDVDKSEKFSLKGIFQHIQKYKSGYVVANDLDDVLIFTRNENTFLVYVIDAPYIQSEKIYDEFSNGGFDEQIREIHNRF